MANGYPYHPSTGSVRRIVEQLRSAFPGKVNAETLKKWSIAPKNESMLLNILRFLKLIDSDGNKITENAKIFLEHDDSAFSSKFGALVKTAYADLFQHFGDDAWQLTKEKLIGYFRSTDESSLFSALAGLAGYKDIPPVRATKSVQTKNVSAVKNKVKKARDNGKTVITTPAPSDSHQVLPIKGNNGGLGMTIRIELNLPVSDDQSVYDRIFKSIKENLMNG